MFLIAHGVNTIYSLTLRETVAIRDVLKAATSDLDIEMQTPYQDVVESIVAKLCQTPPYLDIIEYTTTTVRIRAGHLIRFYVQDGAPRQVPF